LSLGSAKPMWGRERCGRKAMSAFLRTRPAPGRSPNSLIPPLQLLERMIVHQCDGNLQANPKADGKSKPPMLSPSKSNSCSAPAARAGILSRLMLRSQVQLISLLRKRLSPGFRRSTWPWPVRVSGEVARTFRSAASSPHGRDARATSGD
jgi:hypothetical protein